MVVSPPGDSPLFAGASVLCEDGDMTVKLLLLRSNSGEVFLVAWAVRSVCSPSICVRMGSLFCRASFSVKWSAAWASLFHRTDLGVGGSGGSLPLSSPGQQRRWSFSVLNSSSRWFGGVCSCGIFQCLELCCGVGKWILLSWFGFPSGLPCGGDGDRRTPKRKKNGLLCACAVIFFISRGFLVNWACTVLSGAI